MDPASRLATPTTGHSSPTDEPLPAASRGAVGASAVVVTSRDQLSSRVYSQPLQLRPEGCPARRSRVPRTSIPPRYNAASSSSIAVAEVGLSPGLLYQPRHDPARSTIHIGRRTTPILCLALLMRAFRSSCPSSAMSVDFTDVPTWRFLFLWHRW